MAKRRKKKIEQNNGPYALCVVSIASVRKRPSHEEKMITQLLFGEQIRIIEIKGKNWFRIKCDWDQIEGWVDSKQVCRISEEDYYLNTEDPAYSLELVHGALGKKSSIPICIGSSLVRYDGISFSMPEDILTYSGQIMFHQFDEIDQNKLVKIAMKYIHAPYLFGGRSPFGIDAGGLIQMVYKIAGIRLPRNPSEQVYEGELIDFFMNAEIGDLAFFDNSKSQIIHGGLFIGENKILHSYGKVRIDYFDHHGIYNEDLGRYTHKLRVIKRIKSWPQQYQLNDAISTEENL